MHKTSKAIQVGLGLLLGAIQQLTWAVDPAMQIKDYSAVLDMAVAQDGSVWLIEFDKIQHITADGMLINQFGNGRGGLPPIISIALATDGSVWLSSNVLSLVPPYNRSWSIQHYTADGTLSTQFAIPGYIGDLKIAADGSVWTTDLKITVCYITRLTAL